MYLLYNTECITWREYGTFWIFWIKFVGCL